MKKKSISIIICIGWILICFIWVFVPKEYMSPLPDEISIKDHFVGNIEFRNDMLIKVYREGGKYYLSSESLVYDRDPEIVELTKSEYRYCTRVDTYRLENQVKGGSVSYCICVKRGNKEECYNAHFAEFPLYEIMRIKEIKDDTFDGEYSSSEKLMRLERFLDEGKFELAYVYDKSVSYPFWYYKNSACEEYYHKWYDLHIGCRHEQDLNMFILKQYEKGKIEFEDIDLNSSLDKKEELYERITGKPSELRGTQGYGYNQLLKSDDKPITSESKQLILDKTTKKIDRYDHTAYEYIEYEEDNFCIYEFYLPDEHRTCIFIAKKPSLMPDWYLEWAINYIILNDKLILSPGLIYQVVLFLSLTAPICFVLMFFGYRSTKKQWYFLCF